MDNKQVGELAAKRLRNKRGFFIGNGKLSEPVPVVILGARYHYGKMFVMVKNEVGVIDEVRLSDIELEE